MTMIPDFIYFCGVDGSGKTTLAQKLHSYLESNGIRTRYVWLRFNPIFTIPILIYGRIIGLTIYETKNGVKIGYHYFSKSKLIKTTYPLLLFLDILVGKIIKIDIPHVLGYNVICDRYVIDSVIDLIVDLKLDAEESAKVYRLFSKLLPERSKIIYIDTNLENIYSRRNTLKLDNTISIRHNLYASIFTDIDVYKVSNNESIEASFTAICRYIGGE